LAVEAEVSAHSTATTSAIPIGYLLLAPARVLKGELANDLKPFASTTSVPCLAVADQPSWPVGLPVLVLRKFGTSSTNPALCTMTHLERDMRGDRTSDALKTSAATW
jgi:hypothetical protein